MTSPATKLSVQEVLNRSFDESTNSLSTGVALTGDIEIGAVELKNATDDTRAEVSARGLQVSSASTAAAVTSVNDQATSTTLLASNTARREAIIQNDSSAVLYIKLGTTASTTDYTIKLQPDGVLITEYAGRIDGIWASDASGAAKITALT